MSQFEIITSFEDIISLARAKLDNHSYMINFSLNVSFEIDMVTKPQLLDVANLAMDFQKAELPDTLYLNHGKFIGKDGIPHIISELKNKHNGNRALMSLISQKEILDSGDFAIPSFMILQFSLEQTNELYVTTYFRALEVSRFLRVNIEEIRMIINQIYSEIPRIERVNLNVFAFRAYVDERINTLVKPKIELLDEAVILALMQDNPKELAILLNEKAKHNTVIENKSLKIINKIMNNALTNKWINPCFKQPFMIDNVAKCIGLNKQLQELRSNTSHNDKIKRLNSEVIETLKTVIEEIEKCQ